MPAFVSRQCAGSSWAIFAAVTATTAGFGGFAGMLSGAATAAVMLAAVILAVRSIAGVSLPRDGHRALGPTLPAPRLRVGVLRHSDPDAAGRPRPRAPSAHLLAA